jgi:transposase
MAQIQIISGVERRRQWNKEQKQALVAAAFAPGATVADIARRADIKTCLIYRWRRELKEEAGGFAEVVVLPRDGLGERAGSAIEITLGNGVHMRIPPLTAPDLAAAVVKAMVRR